MPDKRRRAAGFVGVLVFPAGATFAPAADDRPTTNPDWRLNGDYFRKAASDLVSVGTAPGRWDGKDFLKFAVVAGATGLLFAFDGDIYDWIQDQKTDASRDASTV